MNRLQDIRGAELEFCVTLNRSEAIDPAKILKTIPYAHPVFTPAGSRAQARRHEISSPARRTLFAGAYWGWGFHEDGAASGLRAAEQLL
jgi:predicted NAD/FAD-binding protein